MKLSSSVSVVLLFLHSINKAVLLLLFWLLAVTASTLNTQNISNDVAGLPLLSSSGRSLLAVKEPPDDPNNKNHVLQQSRLVHP
jgi:hypothetical protein